MKQIKYQVMGCKYIIEYKKGQTGSVGKVLATKPDNPSLIPRTHDRRRVTSHNCPLTSS